MTAVLDVLTLSAVAAGAFFFCAGTVALLRFPDSLTRLHALTKADNLGLGLIVLGLMLQVDSVTAALKLAIDRLARGTEEFAARRMDRSIRAALSGRRVDDVLAK